MLWGRSGGNTAYAICFRTFPASIWTWRRCLIQTLGVDEPWCGGPRPVCPDRRFMACVIFLNGARELGTPVICYQPQLFKNKLGIKSQEEMRTIWKLENPHVLYAIFFFSLSGRISKFQPVLMLAHLAALLMKTAASSNARV